MPEAVKPFDDVSEHRKHCLKQLQCTASALKCALDSRQDHKGTELWIPAGVSHKLQNGRRDV